TKLLLVYIHRNRAWLVLFVLYTLIFTLILFLHGLPIMAVSYATLLCIFITVIFFCFSFTRFLKRYKRLSDLQGFVTISPHELPIPKDGLETLYQELIKIL